MFGITKILTIRTFTEMVAVGHYTITLYTPKHFTTIKVYLRMVGMEKREQISMERPIHIKQKQQLLLVAKEIKQLDVET